MKYISAEDWKTLYPNETDIALAEEKGLCTDGSINEKYLKVQSIYYNLLNNIVSEELNFKEIEQNLLKMNENFIEVPEEEKDIYQYLSDNKFFYVRNTLHVEMLTKTEIEKILELETNANAVDEAKKIVFETMQRVITTPVSGEDKTNIIYNAGGAAEYVPNDSLIIGLRFAEEDEAFADVDDEIWSEDYGKRRQIIAQLFDKFPGKFHDIDAQLLEYFSETVIARNRPDLLKK